MNASPQALRLEATLFLPPRSTSHSTARRRSSWLKTQPFLGRSTLRLPRNRSLTVAEGVRFDGPAVEIGEISEVSDGDLAVETCIVRTLPPVVTLEQGIERIREAVEALKLDPPTCSSGFLRFQVAVPPSAKALKWFCSQPELSSVFPLFFISKETDEPSYKSLLLSETRGVFGIGAAVYFERDCDKSSTSGDRIQTKRYISNESTPIVAYGFVDNSFDKDLSVLKHQAGSYYFFIPQIELDEFEGVSVLSATLIWCDSYVLTFEEALHSFESSLVQATSRFCSTAEKCYNRNILSTITNLNMVDGIIPKVYLNALSPGGKYVVDGIKEMMDAPSSQQFCLRLSAGVVLASNMLNHTRGGSYSVEDCANINTLWASLIIEECSRLGLTYFCVAPGSRSSPLTVAASTHPHITCIVCFDERSLAFHAVGYARGSRKPAVVITSSGTAVSNLLPAVVEAHQDFVPLLLLTADRPPELLDAGANQAIDQVKHFGSFVRFFSLPAPTDSIHARMVLTTIDSAVYWATSSPGGPVHLNCPFREPLENRPSKWAPNCLKGLDFWMSSAEPFTKYFDVQAAPACNGNPHEIAEVINILQKVNKGILLIGEIRTMDEMWAVLLLAKHLSWPVVADILSGLRLRKILTFSDFKDHILFIDHFDHALLSDFFSDWTHLDVIIQIGSRITSKRVSKMLERSFPCSYIVVDHHPFRCDPSHIVTHRIRSSIVTFANSLLHVDFPHKRKGWQTYLEAIEMMVARELSFQIFVEHSLTEPQVARIISEALPSHSALFIGNSMAIRDADMYGSGWSECTDIISSMILNSEQFCHLIWVVGNRGASGIDGLVSTSVGFTVGCNKRVLCVIGDVSFLHDTNGLSILSQRIPRKPMTVVVINNHGGAIFSLLPIAERIEEGILNKYFYTSHNISIRGLCRAHGVKHLEVQKKEELNAALFTSQSEEMDFVIEVASSIDENATFHSTLRKFACQAADHALRFLLRHPVHDSVSDVFSSCKVHSVKYSAFRIPLCAPPTMTTVDCNNTSFYREGFILSLSLEDGHVGFGEVSPLDISKENLIDVEEQLRFLIHEMKGIEISCLLPLLKGSFSSWIQSNLGILPSSLFPSVRCGLEMAILSALAARQGCDLLSLLHVQKGEEAQPEALSKFRICGLVDSEGTPTEIADIVAKLVSEGFATIKLKVARRRTPAQDAEVIQEVRKKVGHHIELRVDANRNWTYQEAIQFGSLVKDCGLQYIEEPLKDEADIIKFCEETGLPVALDETIDQITENPLNTLMKYTHHGVVAIVIKPSVVGGFENAALIAQWAHQNNKMAVISSTFESGLGLSAYIHLSCYLEQKNKETCKLMNKEMAPSVAHGLGTYRWLKEDIALTPLRVSCNHDSGFIEASTSDANKLLQSFQINQKIIRREYVGDEVRRYQLPVDLDDICYNIKIQETGQVSHDNVIVFLHGFLGTGEDWTAIMKAASREARCISIDLPGHGETQIQNHVDRDATLEPSLSIDVVADVVYEAIHRITPMKVTVIGYSMGARIALYMALRFTDKVNGAVIISGSPGLKDEVARKLRRATDDSRSKLLLSYGLDLFLDTWYAGKLWNSLRCHPKFNQIVESRLHHQRDVPNLAKVLSDSSIGRQLSLWDDLKHCKTPLLIIVGEKDEKFRRIAQDMGYAIDDGRKDEDHTHICRYETIKISGCGHAVHLENPLPVIAALRRFLSKLEASSNADRREFQTGNV